jgi:hypothetical protein
VSLTFLSRRQQQLQQVGNILQEFGKNSQWEEINKQWKHDPKDTSIDWAMVEREIPHPEIVQTIKQGMEQKWENQMFEEEVKVTIANVALRNDG